VFKRLPNIENVKYFFNGSGLYDEMLVGVP